MNEETEESQNGSAWTKRKVKRSLDKVRPAPKPSQMEQAGGIDAWTLNDEFAAKVRTCKRCNAGLLLDADGICNFCNGRFWK
jgi:hypothetical protein